MEQLHRDVTAAIRSLRSRPGTSILATVALALGIGLTSTMFSIVDGVFLHGLPFERADRILYVGEQDPRLAERRPREVPVNDYLEIRAAPRSFEELAAFSELGADVAAEGTTPRHYQASRITPNAFTALRVRPAIGRVLADADAADGAAPVAVISNAAWRGQFDRDSGIIGRTIRVNGAPTTVIGVMPAGFGFPHDEDIWLTLPLRTAPTRTAARSVQLFGRLRDGVDTETANTELAALVTRLAARDGIANLTGTAVPYVGRFISRQITSALSTMLVAVFGVLVIACFNVSNLLLARAADRVHEVAVQLAIGAPRWRLIRQLLIEGLLLSAAGATAGIAIAFAGVSFFNATMADSTPPFWVDVRVDSRVLLFSSILVIVAAIGSSLMPALRASRIGAFEVLKDGGRTSTGLGIVRFSRSLVIAEIVLSFALLIVSGLMIKSVVAVTRLTIPYRTDLLHVRVVFPDRSYPTVDSARQAAERLLELAVAEPGVASAAIVTGLPDNAGREPFATDLATAESDVGRRPRARRVSVSPGFFATAAIAPIQGRLFDTGDGPGRQPVAIVTADFAQRFPDGALGHRLQVGEEPSAPWRTIVGVVPRLVVANTTSPSTPPDTILLPFAQAPSRWTTLLVATTGEPGEALPAVQRAAGRLDKDLPLAQVTTVARLFHDQSWPIRLFGTVFAAFGLTALLLAAAGLYGVMAFGVRTRTQEVGIRMALGASPSSIVFMLLRQAAVMLGAGMAIGLGIGGWLSQQLRLFLFGVEPWDPSVMATITLVLTAVGLAATFVPARRAASIDPMAALRDR